MSIDVSPRLLKHRRTKIIATIGPATAEAGHLARLIAAGVNGARLNLAHGDRRSTRAAAELVRAAASEAGQPVALIADLAGPKIRTGRFQDGEVMLPSGGLVRVTGRDVVGRQGLVPVDYPRLAEEVRPGHQLMLDDGRLVLVCESVAGGELVCRVKHGGRLTDRKGVSFPDSDLSVSTPTEKDREDARFALELGVDYLALSFVRSGSDLEQLRRLVQPIDPTVRLIAKIERPEALREIDAILDAADAIMVARGDLGVEMPAEKVPAAQDQLVALGRARHRPVVIATQMLESMIRDPRPTRAEVADIAHAVGCGADALMLSGETAIGEYPVEAVEMMDRIIRQTEARQWAGSAFLSLTEGDWGARPLDTNEAVGRAVAQLSRDLAARAILVVSSSGTSGMIVSSARPAAPLLAATSEPRTCRVMNLFWGVVPLLVDAAQCDAPVPLLRELAQRLELGEPGEPALVARGFRDDLAASQPCITVAAL